MALGHMFYKTSLSWENCLGRRGEMLGQGWYWRPRRKLYLCSLQEQPLPIFWGSQPPLQSSCLSQGIRLACTPEQSEAYTLMPRNRRKSEAVLKWSCPMLVLFLPAGKGQDTQSWCSEQNLPLHHRRTAVLLGNLWIEWAFWARWPVGSLENI